MNATGTRGQPNEENPLKIIRTASLLVLGLLLVVPIAVHADDSRASRARDLATDEKEPDPTAERAKAYAHLMRSFFAARRGAFREAGDELDDAIERQPDSPSVHIQAARMFDWIGRRTDAEKLARKAVELAPDDDDAIGFLADLLIRQSATRGSEAENEALALYEQLEERDALDEMQLRQLAQLRWNANDQDGALKAARELLRRRPGDSRAAQAVFQLLIGRGERREALELYLNYLAKHPNDDPFVEEARNLSGSIDAWDLVAKVLDDHDDLEGRATATHGLLAEALLRTGETEKAIPAFEAALLHDSEDPDLRLMSALAYRFVGRLADSSATMRSLADERADSPLIHRYLGETLQRQGDVEGAADAYRTALDLLATAGDPSQSGERDNLRHRLAELELAGEDVEGARNYMEALEQPDAVDSLRIRLAFELEHGDDSDVRSLAKQLRGEDELVAAARAEGDLLLRDGKSRKAMEKYEEAMAAGPPRVREMIAHHLLDEGRGTDGLALLDAWVDEAGEDADVYFRRGAFLYEMERLTEAEADMQRAIELDPGHAQALNYLGYGLADRGERLDEALALIERALEVDPFNGAYLDSLGWVRFKRGEFQQAREPMERAAREQPHDPTILEHLGDLYVKLEEPHLALAAWRRAIDRGAETADEIESKVVALEKTLSAAGSAPATARGNHDDDAVRDEQPPRP